MQSFSFQGNQPFVEAEQWWEGPWGRDEDCKPLRDFQKSKAFQRIQPKREKTAAEHMLKLREQCVLQRVIVRSKDQRSFQVEMTGSRLGERAGPSLDPDCLDLIN